MAGITGAFADLEGQRRTRFARTARVDVKDTIFRPNLFGDGGTDDTKAHYAGLAHNVFEYAGSPQREYLKEQAQETPEVQQFHEAASNGCATCGEGAHDCE